MIRLEVEDYCQDCTCFVGTVDASTVFADDKQISATFIVRCEHRGLCRRIKNHLSEVSKNDEG